MSTAPLDDEAPSLTKGLFAVLALVVVAVAYVVVVLFYNAEGGLVVTGDDSTGADGIQALIEPTSVEAAQNRANVHLTFSDGSGSLTDGSGRLTDNTRLLIQSGGDTQDIRYAAGSVLGQVDLAVTLSGEIASYPFDAYTGDISILADTYERNADGSFTSTGPVYSYVVAEGGVNGWDTSIAVAETPASSMADLHFGRAFSSQVFALVLLALATLLSASAAVVAFLVQTGRRRFEVILMTWTASLLFALPLLRNYMPNSPPIGASIDVYVYLWVIVAALISALLMVVTWAKPHRHVAPAPVARPDDLGELISSGGGR